MTDFISIPVTVIDQRTADLQIGEHYAELAESYGKKAAEYLFRAQWGYGAPEWYDHRLHFLDPEHHFTDFWTLSADNVIRSLPLHGRLLDLCSGDGFYDYHFYRKRAEVICIENNQEAFDFAVAHHSHHRIQYILADVMDYEPEPQFFDVVVIRGAIEHFTEEGQRHIFKKAYEALKFGGYFCGDTPANKREYKLLSTHENEWRDEYEMRAALANIFQNQSIETWTVESETTLRSDEIDTRTTLFWRCRK